MGGTNWLAIGKEWGGCNECGLGFECHTLYQMIIYLIICLSGREQKCENVR